MGMTTSTTEDAQGAWKVPRTDVFAMSKLPSTGQLVFAGPIRVGGGSLCTQAGKLLYFPEVILASLECQHVLVQMPTSVSHPSVHINVHRVR